MGKSRHCEGNQGSLPRNMGERKLTSADAQANRPVLETRPRAARHPQTILAMKALLCTHYGTPDDLVLSDIPDPSAGEGEAVVRIHAAAFNFFDTLIIANKYQTKPALPFSPAAEFAGVVESVGKGVTSVKVGDRVIACASSAEKLAFARERGAD